MTEQKLIDQFHKNSVEIVKVHVQPWKDNLYFDIRIWHLDNPAENGSEKPTHKGLTLNIELLPKLIESLRKTEEDLRRDENG